MHVRVATSRQSRARVGHLPVELWIALVFSALWAEGIILQLPVSLPVRGHATMLEVQYAGPIFLAALLQLIFTVVMKRRWHRESADAFVMLKLAPLIAISVFLYYNFKAWMPFVNPRLYDAEFYAVDQAAAPVVQALFAVRQAVATALPYHVDLWYTLFFLVMFFLSLAVHAVLDTTLHQRQLVIGMCLILLLGGICYWITPAEGPFLYRSGLNQLAAGSQAGMHLLFQEVRATGSLPDGYFSAPLGAMPSLHVAFALFFTLWAARSARPLLLPYIPMLLWIVVEASTSGWHYLVDLPVGALLAILVFALTERLVSNPTAEDSAPQPAPRTTETLRLVGGEPIRHEL